MTESELAVALLCLLLILIMGRFCARLCAKEFSNQPSSVNTFTLWA
jgi:hypothetical protein